MLAPGLPARVQPSPQPTALSSPPYISRVHRCRPMTARPEAVSSAFAGRAAALERARLRGRPRLAGHGAGDSRPRRRVAGGPRAKDPRVTSWRHTPCACTDGGRPSPISPFLEQRRRRHRTAQLGARDPAPAGAIHGTVGLCSRAEAARRATARRRWRLQREIRLVEWWRRRVSNSRSEGHRRSLRAILNSI
jgi:hypothetical protein